MPRRSGRTLATDYDRNVFINCPFDDPYLPLFRALVFAVLECGLTPRCAQQVYDGGQVRIEKIAKLVRDCRWGIHDISRTELNPRGLSRFNMPFELGLFIGAQRFGSWPQSSKSCRILDRHRHRFQQFLSDIAGQDIAAHDDNALGAIKAVRDWLTVAVTGMPRPAGGTAIGRRYVRFSSELPAICAAADLRLDEMTYVEYTDMASTWLREELAGSR